MIKNLLIALIFLLICFGGTYWFLLKFGFGEDPREDFCPVRWEKRLKSGNFQEGDIVDKQILYYRSGKQEHVDPLAFFIARFICQLSTQTVISQD